MYRTEMLDQICLLEFIIYFDFPYEIVKLIINKLFYSIFCLLFN